MGQDVFLVKLSPAGGYVWARQYGILYSLAERTRLTAELAQAADALLRWLDEGR